MAPLRRALSRLFSKQPVNTTETATTIDATAAPTTTTTTTTTHITPITITIRDPVPLDSSKPSLAHLPDPVVRCILAFVHDVRPQDTETMALLSSSLYAQARHVQHHDVHIDLDRSKNVLDRIHLIKRLHQLPAIRSLRVTSRNYNNGHQETSDILACLGDLLPAMTGLRHLFWDVRWTQQTHKVRKGTTTIPIPSPILAALPAELQLHTSVTCFHTSESHVLARKLLNRLAGNQNLRTLSIRVIFLEEQQCVDTMAALKRVMLSCPNLTRLPSIEVWYPRGGCDGYGPPSSGCPYCGLGFFGGEKPLALEELGLDVYPWGVEGGITCRGYRAKGYEWNYWASTFDWSRLVRLNNVPAFLATELAPRLTNLRELVLDERIVVELDYLHNVTAPLELISLPNWRFLVGNLDVIGKFGATLRQLKVHKLESVRTLTPDTDVLATASELEKLSENLHNLEHLVLDIARDQQQWPYRALDAIASFSRLRTVELWFPMGMRLPAPAPALTVSSARHLSRYLRERNKNIHRVTLRSGSTAHHLRTLYGLPDPEVRPSWHEHNAVGLECELTYSNCKGPEEDGGGWLRVSCPDMTAEMNAQMRQLAQQADREPLDPGQLDRGGLRLKVALDGPLDASGWGIWQSGLYPPQEPGVGQDNSVLRRFKSVWKT